VFRKLGAEEGSFDQTRSSTVDSFELGKYVKLQVVNSGIREPIEQLTPVKLETVYDGFGEQASPDRAVVLKTATGLYRLDFHSFVRERLVFKGLQE